MTPRARNAAARVPVYFHTMPRCAVWDSRDVSARKTPGVVTPRAFRVRSLPLIRGPRGATNTNAGYLHGRHQECPRMPIERVLTTRTTP